MDEQPPIGQVLAFYGFDLPPARREWNPCICQFHGERQASASYSARRNAFTCHACGIKGDSIGLIMQREGLNYSQARRFAREQFGESVPSVSDDFEIRGGLSARSRNRSRDGSTVPPRIRQRTIFDGG